jgi:two-component system sensor histidine kinase HydH
VKLSRFVRTQDLVWLLLFAALALASPTGSAAEFELLGALAVFQVVEPRIPFFSTPRGNLASIGGKLVLGWLLMGVSGGISSSYFLILLVPIVTAATTLPVWGTIGVVMLACASYLSFLLFIDWGRATIPEDQARELCLRLLFLGVFGYLIQQLGDAMRTQARRHKETAEQLATALDNLREAEAAVRRSERLAAIGQLMAGLAHELRNPLGTMRASAEVLGKKVAGENEVARELAGYIAAEVDRTNSLVTRFLDFARPRELRRAPVDVTEVIDAAVRELEQRQPPFDVTVYKNYSPDATPVPLDAELMRRVFHNLLVNAAEASPPGAAVTIKTRPAHGGVEIAVIDRGSGIDPKHRESIFNPFFTTKPTGVGLGLAIVAKIVDEHGGTMAVESEPGQGSVFRVVLPAAAPS